ncbi:helix-turn-helix transcriptional regulator [Hymenobacter glaciei]|uniref:helix-turn-helix domain-containing protein n=1 Tax=Hymenobacter glaciei TaxID=877209 RepID=UPI0031E84264
MSTASQLRNLRTRLGLSQHELATWLGLSRAQLAQVETGRDPLPRHAERWLRALAEVGAAPPAVALVPLPGVPATGPPLVVARLAECRYQAQRLHQQLVAQQGRVAVLRARLALGPPLQAMLAPADAAEAAHAPTALRRRWLARLLEAATDNLEPATQAATLLAARCHAWQSEADWLVATLTVGPVA